MEAFSPKPSSSASKVHLAWPSARLPREQFFVDLRRIVQHQVLGEFYRVLLNILFSPAITNERTPLPINCIYQLYRKIDDATFEIDFETDRKGLCVKNFYDSPWRSLD